MRIAVFAILAACAGSRGPVPLENKPTAAAKPAADPRPQCKDAERAATVATTATTGAIDGIIWDAKCNPASGATIVVVSPSQQGEQVVISDETGHFAITALPPGTYVATVYLDDDQKSIRGIEVRLDAAAHLQVQLDPPHPQSVIEIRAD